MASRPWREAPALLPFGSSIGVRGLSRGVCAGGLSPQIVSPADATEPYRTVLLCHFVPPAYARGSAGAHGACPPRHSKINPKIRNNFPLWNVCAYKDPNPALK
jgi:hypothetical protein